MVKVVLNNVVLAESTDTVSVEGNHYFPPSAVKSEYLTDSNTQCGASNLSWAETDSSLVLSARGKGTLHIDRTIYRQL
jgi:hypothetical protein